ncbi:MAG: helix-turn-helix transcriptional regulator [Clostridia bacterium]|nr:helix-turn-helix transcriptional regulator [Clostridia bacterium]
MDQVKTGRFIAECRKTCGMTQMQLAEKLNITDRAVSKWENGRSLPDSTIMLELCGLLNISVNELLNGEKIMEDFKEKSEQMLLEMAKQKEENDRKMLFLEIIIGVLSVIVLLGFNFAAAYFPMADWLKVVLAVTGFVLGLVGIMFALKIEQEAGYYECGRCRHRYVPTYMSVVWAMHVNRTRFMKCPKCRKWSWQKKVINKD